MPLHWEWGIEPRVSVDGCVVACFSLFLLIFSNYSLNSHHGHKLPFNKRLQIHLKKMCLRDRLLPLLFPCLPAASPLAFGLQLYLCPPDSAGLEGIKLALLFLSHIWCVCVLGRGGASLPVVWNPDVAFHRRSLGSAFTLCRVEHTASPSFTL